MGLTIAQLSERLRCAECGGPVHSVKPWRVVEGFGAITVNFHSTMLQKSDTDMNAVVLPNQYPIEAISVPTEASVLPAAGASVF
jgi:hypothetical protein